MKTKTQPKAKPTGAPSGMTFYRTTPQELANTTFLKSLPTKNDAGNSHVETFVLVTDSILKSGVRSFTFTDVLRQCQRYGLEDALVSLLFLPGLGVRAPSGGRRRSRLLLIGWRQRADLGGLMSALRIVHMRILS